MVEAQRKMVAPHAVAGLGAKMVEERREGERRCVTPRLMCCLVRSREILIDFI